MTVGASPVENETREESFWFDRNARVKHYIMALIAEPGSCNFKKPIIYRTMWLVAVAAVFHDWRMLPQEGSAPLCMALVTSLIDARPFEL